MAKQSGFLLQLERRHQREMHEARMFTLQQCKDVMLIAANNEFGFGQDRIKRLSDAFDAAFMEYAQLVCADAESDKEIWYSKAKIDEQLQKICGEYFEPWGERYK